MQVIDLDRVLDDLAATSGVGSQRQRDELLGGLFARLTEDEQHHLVRCLTGEVLEGPTTAWWPSAMRRRPACQVLPLPPSLDAARRSGRRPSVRSPVATSTSVSTPLVAVQPMLAATSASAADAVSRSPEAGECQWKLDGMRV
ncbi:MAG: hypothetical protein R2713_01175 [Ilumatobacteraceae bacterium]